VGQKLVIHWRLCSLSRSEVLNSSADYARLRSRPEAHSTHSSGAQGKGQQLAEEQAIFRQASDHAGQTVITMSYIEILKEEVYDLLAARPRVGGPQATCLPSVEAGLRTGEEARHTHQRKWSSCSCQCDYLDNSIAWRLRQYLFVGRTGGPRKLAHPQQGGQLSSNGRNQIEFGVVALTCDPDALCETNRSWQCDSLYGKDMREIPYEVFFPNVHSSSVIWRDPKTTSRLATTWTGCKRLVDCQYIGLTAEFGHKQITHRPGTGRRSHQHQICQNTI
jgi:hypothetical protein